MPTAPVVPKSLSKPVPASQARSQIQELIDANREKVERLSRGTQQRLVRQLVALEAELAERLERQRVQGRGESWTAADTEAALVQVRELLGRQGPEFKHLLAANAARARALGVKGTVGVLQHFEGKAGGPIRPLSIDAAVAAGDPLLARHEASVARWGARTVGRVAEAMQRGILAGDTFDEMKARLAGKRGAHGVIVQSAGDAARIVRTEGMHAYNAGAHEEALAQRSKRFPDLQKKCVETFDNRTGEDSRKAHGEVRDLEQPFEDGAGRRYLHPPGRPNDRGTEIPWRQAWENDEKEAKPRRGSSLQHEPIEGDQVEEVVNELSTQEKDQILSVVDRLGINDWLAKNPIKKVEILGSFQKDDIPLGSQSSVGYYAWADDMIRLNGGRPPSSYGKPLNEGISHSISSTGKNLVQAMQMTLLHETGHRQTHRLPGGIQDEIRKAYDVNRARLRDPMEDRGFITKRANKDWREYFGECMAAYVFYGPELAVRDPEGYAVVQKALDWFRANA